MPKMTVEVREDNADMAKSEIKAAFARALWRIGAAAEGYAKDLCPVDTGNLRNSITHTEDDEATYVGTNVDYGKYVELGTRNAPAQPYLKPAAANHKGTYQNIVKDELGGS